MFVMLTTRMSWLVSWRITDFGDVNNLAVRTSSPGFGRSEPRAISCHYSCKIEAPQGHAAMTWQPSVAWGSCWFIWVSVTPSISHLLTWETIVVKVVNIERVFSEAHRRRAMLKVPKGIDPFRQRTCRNNGVCKTHWRTWARQGHQIALPPFGHPWRPPSTQGGLAAAQPRRRWCGYAHHIVKNISQQGTE